LPDLNGFQVESAFGKWWLETARSDAYHCYLEKPLEYKTKQWLSNKKQKKLFKVRPSQVYSLEAAGCSI